MKESVNKYIYFLYRAVMILLTLLQIPPEFCQSVIYYSRQPQRIPDGQYESAVNASFLHLYCLIS